MFSGVVSSGFIVILVVMCSLSVGGHVSRPAVRCLNSVTICQFERRALRESAGLCRGRQRFCLIDLSFHSSDFES